MTRLIKLFVSLLYYTMDKCNGFSRRILNRTPSPSITILNYHEVADNKEKEFLKQLRILKRTCSPIRSDLADIEVGHSYYAAVTFDDGYQSVVSNALPQMIKLNIPCTIFIPTAYLGQHPKWDIPKGCPHLKETVMTERQIVDIDSRLVTVGSHTNTHPRLAEIKRDEIRHELEVSKHILEKITGAKVTQLAFPHGSYNEDVLTLSKEIGYEKVFYIMPLAGKGNKSSFLVGRVGVAPDDWDIEFMLKIKGCYRWITTAAKFKGCIKKLISN